VPGEAAAPEAPLSRGWAAGGVRMIERSMSIKIYNDLLGAKGAKGRMVRVGPEGFYEVTLESGGRTYSALLPVQATVILSGEPEFETPTMEVER